MPLRSAPLAGSFIDSAVTGVLFTHVNVPKMKACPDEHPFTVMGKIGEQPKALALNRNTSASLCGLETESEF